MSTFLKNYYHFELSEFPIKLQGGYNQKVFFDSEMAYFFDKFANILGFSGKKRKFLNIFRKVFFLIRSKLSLDISYFFRKVLYVNIVLIGIKLVRRRSIVVKELHFLKRDQAFGIFCRWFKQALRLRSERKLADKIFNEFCDIYSGMGFTLKKRQEYIEKISEVKKQLYI